MQHDLRTGIENMLLRCGGLTPGQSVLILTEPAGGGHYDAGLADEVARVALALGLAAKVREEPVGSRARPSAQVLAEIGRADRTVFLSRLGDQLRFDPALADAAPVMCYALDRAMMASGFGQTDHAAFLALLDCLNAALAAAGEIRVTCPLGTDFAGPGARFPATAAEVSVRRFPLSVFTPVPAGDYAGTIAQAGFLTGTGRTFYDPYTLPLDDVLRVRFDGTRITGFDGPDAARAEAHYRHVGGVTANDAFHVHSWHAGMHPGCAWSVPAGDDLVRWGGGAFGNPRILHFHTCGKTAPGEISINVVDPTIRLDGVALWEDGRLHPDRVPGGAEILARYPDAAALFADPAREVGLAPSGRLAAPPQALANPA
ncbi:MAG: hypothetical protein ACE368_14130 [Paracoccaceae bacterium]